MTTDSAPIDLPDDARILHVLMDSDSPVSRAAAELISAQVADGRFVAVAASREVLDSLGLAPAKLLRLLEVDVAGAVSLLDADAALWLHKYYVHVDVVHAHGLHAAAVAGLALTGLPRRYRPAIIASVGRSDAHAAFSGSQSALIKRTATALLGTTAPLCEDFADDVPIVERASLPAPDVDDSAVPRLSTARVREDLQAPAGSWIVAVPARLKDSTELATILDATSSLPRVRGDRTWVVVFTGGGGAADVITKEFLPRFPHLRLEPQVSTVDIAAAADVVIATEALGGISVEGLMQLRRPVIYVGSEHGGNVWGPAIPKPDPSSTPELLHAIEELIDHPASRVQDGFAARRRVVSDEGFTAENVTSVYARALAHGPR